MDVEGVVNEEVDGDRDVCGWGVNKKVRQGPLDVTLVAGAGAPTVGSQAGRRGRRATNAPTRG